MPISIFPVKRLMIAGLLLFVFACNSNKKQIAIFPPSYNVLNFDTALKRNDNGYYYHGKPFSGYMIQQEKAGRVVYKLPIINGLENGLALAWYNTGEKLLEQYYVDGKIEGVFKQWWPNGNYRYLFNYKNGQFNGTQTVFFPDCKIRQRSNYQMGTEEGLQQTWDSTWQLVSNYTLKNNKLYGVISVQSCIPTATH